MEYHQGQIFEYGSVTVTRLPVKQSLPPGPLHVRGNSRSAGKPDAASSSRGNSGTRKARALPDDRERGAGCAEPCCVFVSDLAFQRLFLQNLHLLARAGLRRLAPAAAVPGAAPSALHSSLSEAKGESMRGAGQLHFMRFRFAPQTGHKPWHSGRQTVFIGSARITCSVTTSVSATPSPV